jgi:hypothetical protein
MALSLLHQTVTRVGATFTPDLTVNGWFTLHWFDDADFHMNAPTALLGLANGQEFIVDIIKHLTQDGSVADPQKQITWDPIYSPANTFGYGGGGPSAFVYPWDGGVGNFQLLGRGLTYFLLNGKARMTSMNPIDPY